MHYFSHESHIIIDTKTYESDNNYPFISLSVTTFINTFLDNEAKIHLNLSNNILFNQLFIDSFFRDIYIEGNNSTKLALIKSFDSIYYDSPLYGIIKTYNFNEWIANYNDTFENYNKFLKIYNRFNTDSPLKKVLFHSHPYPDINELKPEILPDNSFNQTFIISKTVKTRLTRPHGNCSYYDESSAGDRPFGGRSHVQCMRRCVRLYVKRVYKCNPIFIDNYVNELDFESELNDLFCYYLYTIPQTFDNCKNISAKCIKYCPKDCLTVE